MAGRKKREVEQINGGPMADIAFLLLIFFLVATTISTDSGLYRKLPPIPKNQDTEQEIKKRNVLPVLVNKKDQLLVEGERLQLSQLKEKAKEFVLNPQNRDNLPEKRIEEVPYFGEMEISKGVISLQNDRSTSYDMYIRVQNELTAAYNELRDNLAMRKFNKKFDALSKEKQEAVQEIYPMAISEAEPKNVEGD
jgi:biopolymer transport protein ExbD